MKTMTLHEINYVADLHYTFSRILDKWMLLPVLFQSILLSDHLDRENTSM